MSLGSGGNQLFIHPLRWRESKSWNLLSTQNFHPPCNLLLLESNGVMEMLSIDGGEWFDDLWLIWQIDEIIRTNLFFRGERKKGVCERDFDQLVFFTGAGCDGILFAHPINENRVADSEVLVWHPIRDELEKAAADLQTFIENWWTGKLSV